MSDEADSTPDVIDDVSSDMGGDCGAGDDVADICWDSDNVATCTDGQWLVRACPSGTSCIEADNGVTCG